MKAPNLVMVLTVPSKIAPAEKSIKTLCSSVLIVIHQNDLVLKDKIQSFVSNVNNGLVGAKGADVVLYALIFLLKHMDRLGEIGSVLLIGCNNRFKAGDGGDGEDHERQQDQLCGEF